MREESAKLLVVDDEPALREALRSSLEFEGYAVETAADGLTALDLLDRAGQGGRTYDAVLLDVMMPRLDGLSACRRLRASGNLLLELFLTHPRQVLTREQILREVWGFDFEPSSNSLDVYVMYLRLKTEAGGLPRVIHTVRGVGYVLRPSPGDGVRSGPGSRC
ncbi:response regulator transcription factor [Microbispora hainanensis]|uniref:response regulator transcription factor n=1 Tax=Microbispora hainanensis TaxID=568844 RepID=UPI0033C165D1